MKAIFTSLYAILRDNGPCIFFDIHGQHAADKGRRRRLRRHAASISMVLVVSPMKNQRPGQSSPHIENIRAEMMKHGDILENSLYRQGDINQRLPYP